MTTELLQLYSLLDLNTSSVLYDILASHYAEKYGTMKYTSVRLMVRETRDSTEAIAILQGT